MRRKKDMLTTWRSWGSRPVGGEEREPKACQVGVVHLLAREDEGKEGRKRCRQQSNHRHHHHCHHRHIIIFTIIFVISMINITIIINIADMEEEVEGRKTCRQQSKFKILCRQHLSTPTPWPAILMMMIVIMMILMVKMKVKICRHNPSSPTPWPEHQNISIQTKPQQRRNFIVYFRNGHNKQLLCSIKKILKTSIKIVPVTSN